MPKYVNGSSSRVYFEGITIEPGQEFSSQLFVQKPLPAGVVADLTADVYDPVIGSVTYTSTNTYTIPVTDTGYAINIFCTAGSASIQFNGTGVAAILGTGMQINKSFRSRLINTIKVTISSGTVFIVVTKE